MSELKAIESATAVIENVYLVYRKSEADKVIADLEESHKMEVEQLLMEIVGLKKQYRDMDVTHTVHIAKMNALIEELEESQRWRKFPDEKPEEWATVVLRFCDGFYDLAVYMSNGQGWDIGDGYYHKPDEVSHWIPLPKTLEDR